MSGNSHRVINLGLELLKSGSIASDRLKDEDDKDFKEAFSLLGIDTEKPLKLAALRSIFSDPSDSTTAVRYYTPCELDPKTINCPDQEIEPSEFTNVNPSDQSPQNDLVQLERYGSFIATSADQQTPVYDLFKSIAAVYDCLENADSGTDQKCLLVGCDFSGIQDTVYTITSKGALKTLRARSFMLELLCEHIIHEILLEVGSDRHAVIYSGGGGFTLLLPNSQEIVNKISDYTKTLNKWTLEEFEGRLFIALDVMPFDKKELCSKTAIKKHRQTQADNLDRLKRRKFIVQLGKQFTPLMPKQLSAKTECQITHRDDLSDEKMFDIKEPNKYRCMSSVPVKDRQDDEYLWVSKSCYHQFMLGDKLIEAEYIYRYTSRIDRSKKEVHGTLVLPGMRGQNVYYTVTAIANVTPDTKWAINSWGQENVLPYANYVRKHGDLSAYAQKKEYESLKKDGRTANPDDTATFEGLASSSCGADMIGSLRMDVDNLGNLFSSTDNLLQLSARSRMLNLFFKVYLNQICRERGVDILKKTESEPLAWGKPGRNVSIIYAGGDDLFIVGAWDDIIELAFDIQKIFKGFTYGRPEKDGGISGGLTLHQPKFPLYQMARLSAEAEAYAKHDDDGESLERKNRVSLFYDHSKLHRKMRLHPQYRSRYMLSMEWTLAQEFLLPLMKVYRRCSSVSQKALERKRLEIDTFSFATIEKWFAVIEKYQLSNQLYLPTMARVLKGVEREFGDNTALFEELITYLYTTDAGKKNWISHFHIALNWLAYLRRTS